MLSIMAKSFRLLEPKDAFLSTSDRPAPLTNWKLCFICQEKKNEALSCPSQSKRKDTVNPYKSLVENLERFRQLELLPKSSLLAILDESNEVEETLVANSAQFHHTCRLKYNNTKLQRAEKRVLQKDEDGDDEPGTTKRTRSQARSCTATGASSSKDVCLFCGEASSKADLHEVATFQLDRRLRACALLLEDTGLLATLSAGDLVAQGSKYHRKCLIALYNRVRTVKLSAGRVGEHEQTAAGIAFAELVMYIEESCIDEVAPVYKLADLANLYMSRMEQLGVKLETRVHTTRLKQRLLAQFPGMRAQSKGRDVLLAFEEDIAESLAVACELDKDSDGVHLARSAQIVRRQLFGEEKPFIGFHDGCQQNSVPSSLLALVNMILEGPSAKNQSEGLTPAALTIAQLLKFNSVKHLRTKGKPTPGPIRHSAAQETPVPIYVGLMVHAQTRKKELVDRLAHLGMSIAYDRVLSLSADLGNSACKLFHDEKVVCPPKMRGSLFTTAAVDNIDHNPSSTTSTQSFHGTAISLIQHPTVSGAGIERGISNLERSREDNRKTVNPLPQYYTNVPPVTSSIKNVHVPATSVTFSKGKNQSHLDDEHAWLEHTRTILQQESPVTSCDQNTSWGAFHARKKKITPNPVCPTAMLPLFQESAHTVAMIKHSMDVIRSAVQHLNHGQTPVITVDQPLYALAKQIQWKWPELYGEDKFVVMFGGLHIELAALKTIGDWLQGSGWVEALVQAEVATPGIAESFLKASHITRTRRAHQVTAAALYTLQHQAYNKYLGQKDGNEKLQFVDWCQHQEKVCPQFLYWAIVLELQLTILVYVRSLRQASFDMYVDAVSKLAQWFHALDHTNYARWIPVHLRDMVELPLKHPEVEAEFNRGNFTVQKTCRRFSAIPIDQAHEQNNASIKGDGGAIGLTDNPSALRRWMVAGPEVARVIDEFHDESSRLEHVDTHHHDEAASVHKSFVKDVQSVICVIDDFGNPFEEESQDLLVLDSKEIPPPSAKDALYRARNLGKLQLQEFIEERLEKRSKPIDDPIKKNKLRIFKQPKAKVAKKSKQQIVSLKNDVGLFSRLYIGCQNRDGDLVDFFRHENQACPPSLSDGGSIRTGTKSDLLACLEELSEAKCDLPTASCVVLDGAVIVQMLKPAGVKSFQEYADQVFIPYLMSIVQRTSRLDLVWDRYIANSLKSSARAKRGKGIRRRVVAGASLPSNWASFLRVDDNKTELFAFLSEQLYAAFQSKEKQLIITDGDGIMSKPQVENGTGLFPCNHEEADSRMVLHAAHAAHHAHHKILIRTVDTDVVVLAVALASSLLPDNEIWLSFGTGKRFRYLAAHEIAQSLGPEKSTALPMFHAVTGCDSVSAFAGRGKKTAWTVWNTMPQLTAALLQLSSTPETTCLDDILPIIERFVILLYDRTATATDINDARRRLFSKRSNILLIPPTRAALQQHLKRAVYQGGYVWGQTKVAEQLLPLPTDWGWMKTSEDLYEPFWTELPEASKTCPELLSCSCRKGCVKKCKCKKAGLRCTALCACEGDCTED